MRHLIRILPSLMVPLLTATLIGQTLDQDFSPGNTGSASGSRFPRAQTFTVGLAGTLSQVDVILNNGSGTFTCRLHSVPAGGPTGNQSSNVLATSTTTASSGFVGAVSFDFESAAIQVTPGDVLMISLQSPGGNWWSASGNRYTGGDSYAINTNLGQTSWSRTSGDLQFRTFVREPFSLSYSQPVTGGLDVMAQDGPPSAFYFHVFTTDAANSGAGLGTGWWGGLHIPIGEFLSLANIPFAPIQGNLDSSGALAFTFPPPATVGLSGVTIYANVHAFDPATMFLQDVTPVIAYTLQ